MISIKVVVVVVLACATSVQGQQDPIEYSESPGFSQLCQRLMQQKLIQLQAGGGVESGAANVDTTVARTVANDGVAISVENNPSNVDNNTVIVKPTIFNIAAINLELTSAGTSLFLPLDGVNMNALLQRSQAAAANGGGMRKEEGINVFVPMDKMPASFGQCMTSKQFKPQPVPATLRMTTATRDTTNGTNVAENATTTGSAGNEANATTTRNTTSGN